MIDGTLINEMQVSKPSVILTNQYERIAKEFKDSLNELSRVKEGIRHSKQMEELKVKKEQWKK